MDGILLVFVVAFVLSIISSAIRKSVKAEAAQQREIIIDKPVCPPHAWYWIEVKDHEGTVHAHKMACQRCGPLKPLN